MYPAYRSICEQFHTWLDTLGYASRTADNNLTRAREFLSWLTAHNIYPITELTHRHITTFYDYLKTRENQRFGGILSDGHLNDSFAAVDRLLTFLHQMGAQNIPAPLNHRIKLDKEERIRKIDPFTIAEIKLLQATIADTFPHLSHIHRELKHRQLRLIFALHYGCGLRLGEGYNLHPSDINFSKRTLHVRQAKGYKDRIVPLSDNILKALQDYLYNFRNLYRCGHDRLYVQAAAQLRKDLGCLHRLCEDPGVQSKRLTFHQLRHSIATHLLQKGMSMENIARFLGHSTLTSTQVYTHIANR